MLLRLCVALLAVLCLIPGQAGAADLTIALTMRPASSTTVGGFAEAFAKNVAQRTANTHIVVHGARALYNTDEEALAALINGELGLALVNSETIGRYAVDIAKFNTPFNFTSPDEVGRAIQELRPRLAIGEKLTVLGLWPSGFYNLVGRQGVRTKDDLAGVRVLGSQCITGIVTDAGGTMVNMPRSEISKAFGGGSLDLMEIDWSEVPPEFTNVISTVTLTRHRPNLHVLVASLDYLDKIPENVRNALHHAGLAVQGIALKKLTDTKTNFLKTAEQNRLNIVTLSPVQIRRFLQQIGSRPCATGYKPCEDSNGKCVCVTDNIGDCTAC